MLHQYSHWLFSAEKYNFGNTFSKSIDISQELLTRPVCTHSNALHILNPNRAQKAKTTLSAVCISQLHEQLQEHHSEYFNQFKIYRND